VGGKIEGGPNEGCAFGFGKSFGPKTKRKIAKVKSFKASEAFRFFFFLFGTTQKTFQQHQTNAYKNFIAHCKIKSLLTPKQTANRN